MKKLIILTAIVIFPLISLAHPGRTASDGKHYCRTNCSSWGVSYGTRHGHGSSSAFSGQSFSTSSLSGYSNNYSYTASPAYKTNSDCSSGAFSYLGSCYYLPGNAVKSAYSGFNCNLGYEKVGYGLSASCLPQVSNGMYIGTALYCNNGYKKLGSYCLKEDYKQEIHNNGFQENSYFENKDTDEYVNKKFKEYYYYNREDKEISKKKISSSCREEKSTKADKPYFKSKGSCYYCEAGYITDKDRDSCYSMESICVEIMGEGAISEKDGKCSCSDSYRRKNGVCIKN